MPEDHHQAVAALDHEAATTSAVHHHNYSTNTSAEADEHMHSSLPYALVKRLIVMSLIFGLVGGMAGSYGFIKYFASSIPADRKELVVQESSAVIDVVKKVSPSVVSITSKSVSTGFFGARQQEGAGTGIIVSSDGLILTNKHVVSDANASYTVVDSTGKEYKDAQVISRDPFNDIAFVRIKATGLSAADIGDSGAVKVGQRVVAIGNALGQFQNTVTDGIISGVSRGVQAGEQSGAGATEELQNLFQTDAAINPGNSGGPLVNLGGQVIGINTAVAGQGAQNIGFAIPINEVKSQISSVKEQGHIVRPYLGVRFVPLTRDVASSLKLSVTEGAFIKGSDSAPAVVVGSPAAKAGIKDGDIITKVAGDTINITNSLQSLVSKHKVGDKITLTLIRDGKTITVDVALEEAPGSAG